jgi:sulfur carrier protein ThiS
MLVRAKTLPEGREYEAELAEGAVGADLVREMGLPIAAVLLLRGGKPVPIDEALNDGDELEIIHVASGG